ncbi:MAG: hypothetical protein ACQEXN_05615 [Actinomycetota bacterium]
MYVYTLLSPTLLPPGSGLLVSGYFERLDDEGRTVYGWAYLPGDSKAQNTTVRVLVNGVEVGKGHPIRSRQDLTHITDELTAFEIKCSVPLRAMDVLSDRVVIEATNHVQTDTLRLTPAMKSNLQIRLIKELIETTPEFDASSLTPSVISANRDSLRSIMHRATQGEVSSVELPVGLISSDLTAQLGRNGQLFLTGGSNGLLGLYGSEPTGPNSRRDDIAKRWKLLFDERRVRLEALAIRYVQTIIPEKLTVLSDMAPVEITGPTQLLQNIEHNQFENESYCSSLAAFKNWTKAELPYSSNDTHFSPEGARGCFNALVESIDPSILPLTEAVQFTEPRYSTGDLSNRFFGVPILTRNMWPATESAELSGCEIQLVDAYDPPSGHNGKRRVWKNSSAPSPFRILAFGNSFFDDGRDASRLSWWFSRYFSEFRFEWTTDFDFEIIEQYRPDVVVGQTVERFLTRVPDA